MENNNLHTIPISDLKTSDDSGLDCDDGKSISSEVLKCQESNENYCTKNEDLDKLVNFRYCADDSLSAKNLYNDRSMLNCNNNTQPSILNSNADWLHTSVSTTKQPQAFDSPRTISSLTSNGNTSTMLNLGINVCSQGFCEVNSKFNLPSRLLSQNLQNELHKDTEQSSNSIIPDALDLAEKIQFCLKFGYNTTQASVNNTVHDNCMYGI